MLLYDLKSCEKKKGSSHVEVFLFGRGRYQILLIKAVCLARLQAREFGVATCVLKIFSKIFFLDFYN
jgi:hypothetical protein